MSVDLSPLLIRASAGTGKTFRLTNRFISLLAAGEKPRNILATTFTRKAAGEIKDRLFSRLAGAALDADSARDLSQQIAVADSSQEFFQEILRQVVKEQNRLQIGTLDSFFINIAKVFAIELGLSLSWRIVEPVADKRLQAQAIQQTISKEGSAAVAEIVQLLKKGMVDRSVHWQIESELNDLLDLYHETGPEAWNWIEVDKPPTDKAISSAVESLLKCELPQKKSGGVDSNWRKAIDRSVELANEHRWAEFIRAGIPKAIIECKLEYYRKEISPEIIECYEPLLHCARTALLNKVKGQTLATYHLLNVFGSHYTELKRNLSALRFDDVKRLLKDALQGEQSMDFYYRLDAKIKHLLLDEFQDTSRGEWQVLQPIADEILSRVHEDSSFFCVGDVKQAIYHWRGGVSEIFSSLVDRYSVLEQEYLEKSYRSAPAVIDVVNKVFEGISENKVLEADTAAVSAWAEGFSAHTTAKSDVQGYVSMESSPLAEEGEKQPDVTLRYAAQRIKQLHTRTPGASIGVLVRTNRAVGLLINELKRGDDAINASEESGNALTDSQAVVQILSLMSIADHPGDTVSRFHLANSPLGELIGYKDFADSEIANKLSADWRAKLLSQGYGKSVDELVRLLAKVCAKRDVSRLMQLAELAYEYEGSASLRVSDFVRYIRSAKVEDPSSAPVRVMTIHQAKGLQFDIVVLPELNASFRPSSVGRVLSYRPDPVGSVSHVSRNADELVRALSPQMQEMHDAMVFENVKESLSILYVALTRAVNEMLIVVPPSSPKEKSIPKTFAGALRVALAGTEAIEEDTLLFSQGDPNWQAALPVEETPAAEDSLEPIVVPKLKVSSHRRRGLVRQTPSSLEGGAIVDIASRLNTQSSFAAELGTLQHSFFEEISWLQDGKPTRERLIEVAQASTLPQSEIAKAIDEFYAYLELPKVKEVLTKPEGEVEVFREQRFAVRIEDSVMSGIFDRIHIHREGGKISKINIYDYKTDKIESDETLKQKQEFYAPQIQSYIQAAAKMYFVSPELVSGELIFLK